MNYNNFAHPLANITCHLDTEILIIKLQRDSILQIFKFLSTLIQDILKKTWTIKVINGVRLFLDSH